MAASGVTTGSASFSTPAGIETPIRVRLTGAGVTTILAVPAAGSKGSNQKKVLNLRCATITGVGTPTFVLDILGADTTTVYILRGNSAFAAGEVYREIDILLLPGETLRGTASTQVDITGSYVDIGRGSSAT